MSQNGTKLNIELDVNEVNQIIIALSEKPFKDVANLIMSVRKQASDQLTPPPPAAPPVEQPPLPNFDGEGEGEN